MKKIIALILIFAFSLSLISCKSQTRNLTKENEKKDDIELELPPDILPTVKNDSQTPEDAVIGFSVDLLKNTYSNSENTLVSPLSVALALSMTAGGSDGNTYSEFQNLLGRGVALTEMNEFYKALSERIDDSELTDVNVANSIWIRDNKDMISVKESFLNYAEEYFDADVFLSPFNKSTVRDINLWVEDETDSMIKKIIDDIDSTTVMYLINALSFDAEWKRAYDDTNEYFKFLNAGGSYEQTTGMISNESIYLEDESTTGFIKPYKGEEFSFAVFLPNEDINIDDYVSSLTGEKIKNMLDTSSKEAVETVLPKFTYEFDISLNDVLKSMGLKDVFDSKVSDLSRLGSSSLGNLYVSKVLHKTFIEVAEKGTRAAAVTVVAVDCESAAIEVPKIKKVIVNRPFVFAIIDNATNTPLFIGSVLSVE